jgi:hypothetical protein
VFVIVRKWTEYHPEDFTDPPFRKQLSTFLALVANNPIIGTLDSAIAQLKQTLERIVCCACLWLVSALFTRTPLTCATVGRKLRATGNAVLKPSTEANRSFGLYWQTRFARYSSTRAGETADIDGAYATTSNGRECTMQAC